jgi:uncharacterized iron-regulated protein
MKPLSFGLLLAVAVLSACTTVPQPPAFERPVVLLGEVHDHPQQHVLRLAAFDAWLATGARPALLMEQLDLARQPEIDRLRAQGTDAAALVKAVGGPGWHWPFYQPFIERALRHGLPIVAANLPREGARSVMRNGLAAEGFDAAVPEPVLAAQAALIEDSHCGMVDAAMARRMAQAQVARDQLMARAVHAHAARGVLLLAGNGHVRTDLGVPIWLDPATRARAEAIGVLEAGDTTRAFDRIVRTAPHPRPDPCEAMRQPPRRPGG